MVNTSFVNPSDFDPVHVFAALPGQAVRVFGYAPMFRLDGNDNGVDNDHGGALCLATQTTGNNCADGTLPDDIALIAFHDNSQSGNLRFATTDHISQPQIRMTITPSGNVGIATTTPANIFTIGQGAGHAIADSWDTYSSAQFKTNIHTYPHALETVMNLRGVTYNRNVDGKSEIGVIAEEVAPVIPEIVSFQGGAAQGVDYSRLTAVLIQAVKEQQEEITRLKARLDKIGSQK